nr:protein trichome birefringence-like 6 [Ipomoea batatas]
MEKQRSFSIKPTRFLVFTFTICLSAVFLIFFSVWLVKISPSPQENHLHLNSNKDPSVQVQENGSPVAEEYESEFAVEEDAGESKFAAGEVNATDVLNGNFTITSVAYFSSIVVNDTLLGDTDTHLAKSDLAVNQSENVQDCGSNGVDCNSKQQHVSDITFSKKIRGPRSSVIEKKSGRSVCDVTIGKWIIDESYPLYTNISCPFIDEGFSCQANGRQDKDYMKWRWKPQDCDIPRFNATHMLELIRGKRLVFVGDSINRNQWESMLCLLMGAIKDPKKVYETHGRRITKGKGNYSFKFVDYKCTVEFYVTHFLVREGKARIGRRRGQTLRIDAIDRGSSRWSGADILVFNTAHWWSHHKTRAGINYYQEGDQVHPRLDVSTAFRRALMTWASWVDTHIHPRKTQVFFRTSSPAHFSGGQWNTGGHCREASHPLKERYSTAYPKKNMIVEQVIRQMKTPVTILNITGLSDYRIDGHPSTYGRKSGSKSGVQDCSHWCLPGVPDTWNEILYYQLQLTQQHRIQLAE